jgi:threonylcarbamoyladenosine tRNA methylthiotransferase MtaB
MPRLRLLPLRRVNAGTATWNLEHVPRSQFHVPAPYAYDDVVITPADGRPVVSILTLGCKLNQSDSEAIARRLAGEGVRVTDRPARGAAAFVINTCSVTHVADRKARHLVRLARRLSPEAQIVLTGCYAETAPAGIGEITGANIVLRNVDKPTIASRILERLAESGDPIGGCPTPVRNPLRTRAFIKIQEGCDELCAFCIVPYTRGREVSVPIEDVVRQVQAREADGVLEVVLTGTQLGNYGRDLGWPREEQGPHRLLATLLERTSIPRIRLSSLQAQDISAKLADIWSDNRLCPHFHIPLQSGSDAVLGPMRRRYTADQYREAIALIRERVPDVAITTDVIAGFPGETDDDFEATAALCDEIGFAAMHCFPYSRRPHTGADHMKGHLPPPVKRKQLERLLDIANRSSDTFRRSYVGRTLPVLWEQQSDGLWEGLTPNYIRAYSDADAHLENRILATRLVGLHGEGVLSVMEASSNS